MNRYIPTLENVFLIKCEKESIDLYKKRVMAVELLASIQPLIFFQHDITHTLSIQNILHYVVPGSIIGERVAVSSNNVILISP